MRFHTLRLESSQSITEGLSISGALLVAAQHPEVSLHTLVLEHWIISNILGGEITLCLQITVLV